MSTAVQQVRRDDGYELAEWTSLAAGETGDPMNAGRIPGIKTLQLSGTFNSETVDIQGSMDGSEWTSLHGFDYETGTFVSLSALAEETLIVIVENPLFVRPVVSAGSGVTLKLVIGGNSRG